MKTIVEPNPTDRTPTAPHGVLTRFYTAAEKRQEYVRSLFDKSAGHYDWISAVLSFGTDKYYRKKALAKAGLKPGMVLLDVATGTGLVAQAALDLGLAEGSIVGVDPSWGMLAENRKRRGIPLLQGGGENLPVRSSTVDFISMGYALRHVESLELLFAEFRRVLKPGGKVLIMEISKPKSRVQFALMKIYMQRVVPWIARLRPAPAELPRLMEYYWETIAECVPPERIVKALGTAGFSNVRHEVMHAILSDYAAQKG